MTTQTPLDLELSESASYQQLFDHVDKPLFYLKDANVPSKHFNDWRKAGLWYNEGPEKRTWTKLNLEEYIWLKMIQQMRQFGCSTELILRVKEQLIATLDFEKELVAYRQTVLDQMDKMQLEPEHKKELLESLNNGEFIRLLKESDEGKMFSAKQSTLRSLIFTALIKHQHAAILVFLDGHIAQWLDEIHLIDPRVEKLFKRTHIYLSITEHLLEFLTDPDKESFISPLQLLNSEEWQVLSALRDKTLKELTIQYIKEGKSKKVTKLMFTTKGGELDADDTDTILHILMNKKYSAFEFKRKNGNRFYFERESRRTL